ncbi:uncharacterized protein LOC141630762 [Silene latifolia]|uniref:uncharacterized protein LOC141630762 n=1 Tax=Silene latifolia TaxID=37657 RepID=UPI003D77B76D
MKIASWNVRGLNCPLKQTDVRDFLIQNHLDVVALLETRVKIGNASRILSTSFKHWDSICNYDHHYNGRIWLLYNPFNVTVTVQSIGDQWISCIVLHKVSSTSLNLTVVYGSNDAAERNALWTGLQAARTSTPWLVMGDFNVIRCPSEKLGPHPPILHEMMDFNSCLISCNLDDIAGTGADMTWTNKQDSLTRVWSKLDRALVNQQWITTFPTSHALFLESGLSDHSPVVVQVQEDIKTYKRFSFLNSWIQHPNYGSIVRDAWAPPTDGNPMFRIFTKLRKVKHALTCFHRENYSDLTGRVKGADNVSLAFQDYYTQLLGQTAPVHNLDAQFIGQGPCVTEEDKISLVQDITSSEIKAALFSIDSNSSPGVDGFSSGFFKSSWDIIKGDFCAVVQSFFRSGRMAKQANSTLISLIPKKATATSVLDYRPISCCTVFYKTVSKILSNRIQPLLPYLIGEEQAAFVKGRNIFENIMLSQSLIKGYARKALSPRCLIKVDIKKAFDSIQWDFLSQMLTSLGFPPIFSKWIMGCITNTWYSFKINGGIAGFFPGKSGIRQGDPLSPYLFVLSMEILSRYLRILCDQKNGIPDSGRKMVFKSWKSICSPWSGGGFNFKDLSSWNRSLLVKWLALLLAPASSLWAKWQHAYVLKGTDIWSLQTKDSFSTSMKGILIIRDLLVESAGSIQTAQDLLQSWVQGSYFHLHLAYDFFRAAPAQGNWTKGLSYSSIVPSHRITCSLAAQGQLATQDNVKKRGYQFANRCYFCLASEEDHDHLFFSCPFTAQVWSSILNWMSLPHFSSSLPHLLAACPFGSSKHNWKVHCFYTSLAASVNQLWWERNQRLFCHKTTDAAGILRKIKNLVLARLSIKFPQSLLSPVLTHLVS